MRFATLCHGALTQNHVLVYDTLGNRVWSRNYVDLKMLLLANRQPAITANDNGIEYLPHRPKKKQTI